MRAPSRRVLLAMFGLTLLVAPGVAGSAPALRGVSPSLQPVTRIVRLAGGHLSMFVRPRAGSADVARIESDDAGRSWHFVDAFAGYPAEGGLGVLGEGDLVALEGGSTFMASATTSISRLVTSTGSWTPVGGGVVRGTAGLVPGAPTSTVVWACTYGRPVRVVGLFTSRDAGVHWRPVLRGRVCSSLSSSSDGRTLLAMLNKPRSFGAQRPRIARSIDSGKHWSLLPVPWRGLEDSAGDYPVAVEPARPRTAFTAFATQIWRSTDAGSHWSVVWQAPKSAAGRVSETGLTSAGFAIVATPSAVVVGPYATGTGYETLVSWNHGSTWTRARVPRAQIEGASIRNAIAAGDAIVIPDTGQGSVDLRLWVLTRGARSWSPRPIDPSGQMP